VPDKDSDPIRRLLATVWTSVEKQRMVYRAFQHYSRHVLDLTRMEACMDAFPDDLRADWAAEQAKYPGDALFTHWGRRDL
jgi:hypothetical protein